MDEREALAVALALLTQVQPILTAMASVIDWQIALGLPPDMALEVKTLTAEVDRFLMVEVTNLWAEHSLAADVADLEAHAARLDKAGWPHRAKALREAAQALRRQMDNQEGW